MLPGAVGGCSLAICTFHRNFDYKSDLSIWHDTVDKMPYDDVATNNVGNALQKSGRIDEAIVFSEGPENQTQLFEGHYNLGSALQKVGRTDEAIAHYRRALDIKHDYRRPITTWRRLDEPWADRRGDCPF